MIASVVNQADRKPGAGRLRSCTVSWIVGTQPAPPIPALHTAGG